MDSILQGMSGGLFLNFIVSRLVFFKRNQEEPDTPYRICIGTVKNASGILLKVTVIVLFPIFPKVFWQRYPRTRVVSSLISQLIWGIGSS